MKKRQKLPVSASQFTFMHLQMRWVISLVENGSTRNQTKLFWDEYCMHLGLKTLSWHDHYSRVMRLTCSWVNDCKKVAGYNCTMQSKVFNPYATSPDSSSLQFVIVGITSKWQLAGAEHKSTRWRQHWPENEVYKHVQTNLLLCMRVDWICELFSAFWSESR